MKTYGFLKREDVHEGRVASAFKGDTQEMMRAAVNPDHCAEAVKVVREMLEKKGVKPEEIENFYKEWDEISVSPLSGLPSVRTALKRAGRWRVMHRVMQVVGLMCITVWLTMMIVGEAENLSGGFKNVAVVFFYVGVALCLTPGVRAFFWTWPSRVLLLRPFGIKDVSKDLKRFIRRNLAFYGHVFTLADQHMKESFWLWLWETLPKSAEELFLKVLCVTRLVDNPKRKMFIKKAYHYRVLKRRLGKRWLLNTFWLWSWDKIRKIRTTDAWWQRCIDLLAANCEVIVVDLTVVKSGTHWELRKISEQALEKKSVFIVRDNRLEDARKVLVEYWPAWKMPEVFCYNERGVVGAQWQFEERMAEILAIPRPKYGRKPRTFFWWWISLITFFLPVYGFVAPLITWRVAKRSEGRLRGRYFGLVMLCINVALTVGLFGLMIHSETQMRRRQAEAEARHMQAIDATQEAETPTVEKPVETAVVPAVVDNGPRELLVPSQYGTIQGAIDAARSGDTVTVSTGEYVEQLRMKEGVALRGAANARVEIKAAQMPALIIEKCGSGEVDELLFDGQWMGDGTEPVVKIVSSTILISGCRVDHAAGVAIDISGAADGNGTCTISKAYVDGSRKSGICLSQRAVAKLSECQVYRSVDGIGVDGTGTRLEAEGILSEENVEDGMTVQNEAQASVKKSSLLSNGKYGCRVVGRGTTAEVEDVDLSFNADGLLVSDQAEATIKGGVVSINKSEGIYVYNGAKVSLKGVECWGNKDFGIVIGKGATIEPGSENEIKEVNHMFGNVKGDVFTGP